MYQNQSTKQKSNSSIGKHKRPLTRRHYNGTINDRKPVSVERIKTQLGRYDDGYVLTMLNKKARHNIDMFRIVDTKAKAVIANITANGDLALNNDYKHNRGLMKAIITFFTTNAKVQHTYTY